MTWEIIWSSTLFDTPTSGLAHGSLRSCLFALDARATLLLYILLTLRTSSLRTNSSTFMKQLTSREELHAHTRAATSARQARGYSVRPRHAVLFRILTKQTGLTYYGCIISRPQQCDSELRSER
jgi:hypothetical protein